MIRIFAFCSVALSVGAFAQSLTGSFAPAAVAASTASTLTLIYSGFTPASSGAIFRLYYKSTDFSSGPTVTSTVSDYQGTSAPTPGTLASCAGANTYVTLNWVNFGNAWPATASGELAKIAVTTSAAFAANTNVCIADDAGGPVARPGVASTYPLNFAAAPVPTAPTISPLTGTNLLGGTGAVSVNVATAGIATGSLGLACTIPPGTAAFAVTSGGTRTITAPATVGANPPAIGLSCTSQAALQTATLSCAQTATPGPNPAALTATITCPAIVVVIPAVTATTPPGALALPSYSVSSTPTSSSAALFFNTTGGPSSLTCVAGGTGYSVTPSPLALTVGTSSAVTVTYTGAAVGTFAGTLTCTAGTPATGGPFVYQLSTVVQPAQVIGPTVQVPTIGALGLGLMSLLIAGFAGFQQRRRVK